MSPAMGPAGPTSTAFFGAEAGAVEAAEDDEARSLECPLNTDESTRGQGEGGE